MPWRESVLRVDWCAAGSYRRSPARLRTGPAQAVGERLRPVPRPRCVARVSETSRNATTAPVQRHARREPHAARQRVDEGVLHRVADLLGRCRVEAPARVSPPAPEPRFSTRRCAGPPSRRCRRASRPAARLRCWNSAPSAATPNVPPTIRLIERIPDAAPALSARTAFIAAVDIGDITKPMPRPMQHEGGQQHAVAAVDGDVGLQVERGGDHQQPAGHQRAAGRPGRPAARRSAR